MTESEQKIQVFTINMGIIFIWNEKYHISLVAISTPEIFTFIPHHENKSSIYKKNFNILYVFLITYHFTCTCV